ncbi:MAG: fibronectin type III domain-containing protein [Candidatus Nanopelagicales bacterium]
MRTPTPRSRHVTPLLVALPLVAGLLAVATPAQAAGSLTPVGTVTEFVVGDEVDGGPSGITTGPDGAVWFTDYLANDVGRIAPGGDVTRFPVPTAAAPNGITVGPDGALWFTQGGDTAIGRVTTTGSFSRFADGVSASGSDIAVGSDGALWFTQGDAGSIGRISTDGKVTEYSTGISTGSSPNRITSGPDGALWFTEVSGASIGRITTDGVVTEFPTGLGPDSRPFDIAEGPDGALWFTDPGANRIGRITTSGDVTSYADGIAPRAGLRGITTGPDGALWFAEGNADRIARITTAGEVTQYGEGISALSQPTFITPGPDGALWFSESALPNVGRITTGVPGRPTAVQGVVADRSIVVSWTPPSDQGASAISEYVATATPGGRTCRTATTSCTITGLAADTRYSLTVRATNDEGTGPASVPSEEVSPATVPTEPRDVVASPRDGGALVRWSAPVSTGGAAITGYTVRATPGGRTCTTTGARRCLVTGLTNGVVHSFVVTATTAAGPSSASAPARARVGAPTAPARILVSFPRRSVALIRWAPPKVSGAGPVTRYQITISGNGGRSWVPWAGTSVRLFVRHHLDKGTSYRVRVRALNEAGAGKWISLVFTQKR